MWNQIKKFTHKEVKSVFHPAHMRYDGRVIALCLTQITNIAGYSLGICLLELSNVIQT